jgi:hypothetical protein
MKQKRKHPWRNDRINGTSGSESARAKAAAEVKKRQKQYAKQP